jgi:hypothetical protein
MQISPYGKQFQVKSAPKIQTKGFSRISIHFAVREFSNHSWLNQADRVGISFMPVNSYMLATATFVFSPLLII